MKDKDQLDYLIKNHASIEDYTTLLRAYNEGYVDVERVFEQLEESSQRMALDFGGKLKGENVGRAKRLNIEYEDDHATGGGDLCSGPSGGNDEFFKSFCECTQNGMLKGFTKSEIDSTLNLLTKMNHASAYGKNPRLCHATNRVLTKLRELTDGTKGLVKP